jgi:DNA (cytosine-5)-methyltransferase 1
MSAAGLVVDLFAGGGGASTGIEAALGRAVDLAINHDTTALAVHRANHPATRHLDADIWEVRPRQATGGRPVELLWASPDCTHFSVAKGGTPRLQNIRSLAWVVTRWAAEVRPRVIIVENVSEFRGWGPLSADGRPDKARMGETFRRWLARLEKLGYAVEYRVLDASRFGAPTRRRRLFIVARCDGRPIEWPEPTHGPGAFPLRTAAECIDWSIDCPSIFSRKRPLAPKTLWRIFRGIKRFVLENPRPFIVKFRGNAHSADSHEPLPTVTAGNGSRPAGAGHALGLCVPTLVGVGGRSGLSPATSLGVPLGTITAKGDRGLVIPSLVEMNHANAPRSVDEPLGVVTTQHNRFQLDAPHLLQVNHGRDEARVEGVVEPLTTICAARRSHALSVAHLSRQFGKGIGSCLAEPTPTVMPGGGGKTALAAAHLVKLRGDCVGSSLDEPAPTITASGFHVGEVRAFLTAYYGEDGTGGQDLLEPARTITAKARLGLVTVEGVDYQIVDVGMRMLQPHELLAAQFGAFASTYNLTAAKSKAAKVRLIGNSVAPDVARALVAANLADCAEEALEEVA